MRMYTSSVSKNHSYSTRYTVIVGISLQHSQVQLHISLFFGGGVSASSNCPTIPIQSQSIPGCAGCREVAYVDLDWSFLLIPWHSGQMSTYLAHKNGISIIAALYCDIESLRQTLHGAAANG